MSDPRLLSDKKLKDVIADVWIDMWYSADLLNNHIDAQADEIARLRKGVEEARLSDEELAQMREQGIPRHYCLAQNRCQLPRLHDHIDAQTEEIARLRKQVEAAEQMRKTIRDVGNATMVGKTIDGVTYIHFDQWMNQVQRLADAERAYRANASTEASGE